MSSVRLLLATCLFVALLVVPALCQKSYTLVTFYTDIYVQPGTCQTTVTHRLVYNFNNYVFSRIGIPIRKDSVYTYSTAANDYVKNIFVTSPDTSVTSSSAIAPSYQDDPNSAYLILINFNPSMTQLGIVTFDVSYSLVGFLTENNNNKNVVNWSTRWAETVVSDLRLRVHLPDSFRTSPVDIIPSPSMYNTINNGTLIEYKRAPLAQSSIFSSSTQFPKQIDSCFQPPPSPWLTAGIVAGVVLVICLCVPICCILGCVSRAFSGRSTGYSGTYYTTGTYYDPYVNSTHVHHYHQGHSHSHSSSSSSSNTGGGSGFAV